MPLKKTANVGYTAFSVGTLLLCWQVCSGAGILDPRLIPPPTKVAAAIIEWARSGELWSDFIGSAWRGLTGLLIGAVIGICLGLFTGRTHILDRLLTPILNVFKALPPVAMLPLFITLFGIGNFSKVISIAFATVFPLWVNTHLGSANIPVEFIRSAKLLTASRTKMFFKIVIPASLQSIIAGARIGIAISFIMLYVSELAGASSGLGYQIASSQLAYRMDKMLGALIVLGFTASLVDALFTRSIRYFFPWVPLNKTKDR
jgi:ABC-type nitrate/sulfonate/bicarbonate transport system permease component